MRKIYICHTYYHVYIAIIKTLYERKNGEFSYTDIGISYVSTDFCNIEKNLEATKLFSSVLRINEVHPFRFAKDEYDACGKGHAFTRLINRIVYTKKVACLEEKYINNDFNEYDSIYLFCDPDPIGYYFYRNKIKYTAVEDGLDTYKTDVLAGDRKFFFVKRILNKLGLIYIPHGVSDNAIAIELNDAEGVCIPKRKIIESPRSKYVNALDKSDIQILLSVFESADIVIPNNNDKTVLILAQCLYPTIVDSKEKQVFLYKKIIDNYCEGFKVYIKPHPRDEIEYNCDYFKGCVILNKMYPVQILNYSSLMYFDNVISIFSTAIDNIEIARKKTVLGKSFIEEALKLF